MRIRGCVLLVAAGLALASPMARSASQLEMVLPRGEWHLQVHRNVFTDEVRVEALSKESAILGGLSGKAVLGLSCQDRTAIPFIQWPAPAYPHNRLTEFTVRIDRSAAQVVRLEPDDLEPNMSARPYAVHFWASASRQLLEPGSRLVVGLSTQRRYAAVFPLHGIREAWRDIQAFCEAGTVPAR